MRNILLALALSMVVGMSAHAANYDDPIEGRLKAVYSDFITITVPSTVTKSPDANAAYTGDLDMKITPSTVYDNVSQLSDLKQGDMISVTYHETDAPNNKKVADRITRIQMASEVIVPSTVTTQTTVTTTTVTNSENSKGQ